ncbi:hypothetical protein CABS01_16563 [Colletotrichum abscissum]|uniref:uncharacterized protein n=1 Tax=Colletotrichum abscissum TaxID=1671311 RepID=UPI0027D57EC8|nr:uncharacterized protein CABS01_16563 [Colletotrichum abscissum]KAK1519795.1 hypothetical protein CABS01_16563 [Colletotrichum abscissum]
MSQRTLTWWEGQYDLSKIRDNGWNLQLAQPVASTNAAPAYNVIWQSFGLAPTQQITWDVKYALNFSAVLPGQGVEVVISSKWQPCDKGGVFDINENGFFVPSTAPSKPGWLKVGEVNYQYPGVPGIHIVVGVFNPATGGYQPIFIDSASLPPGSSGEYQPQETIAWWLEGGNHTGQVFSGTRSRGTTKDVSSPAVSTNKYAWWTSFHFDEGTWSVSEAAPTLALLAPPRSAEFGQDLAGPPVEVTLDPRAWLVALGNAIPPDLQQQVTTYLFNALRNYFNGLQITFTLPDGSRLTITYTSRNGVPPGTVAAVALSPSGPGAQDPKEIINNALDEALAKGVLPKGETWVINPQRALADTPEG